MEIVVVIDVVAKQHQNEVLESLDRPLPRSVFPDDIKGHIAMMGAVARTDVEIESLIARTLIIVTRSVP